MPSRRLVTTLAAALAFGLAGAAPAQSEVVTETFRHGPIGVSGYEVKQSDATLNIPKPAVDGFITGMEVDIVDGAGRPVPISRLMLHHIVFSNLGSRIGERRDASCGSFTMLDSRTQLPALAERFYAAGEERSKLRLPSGFGYRSNGADRWLLTYMLMNHRRGADSAFIQYRVTYDTSTALRAATPVWMDVRNCLTDPVFSVPGGGRRGSTYSTSGTWYAPTAGRIVAGNGHVHGGGKSLVLSEPACRNRTVAGSRPVWGGPRHPFYNVRPILHEPGPVNMSAFTTRTGIPIGRGQPLRLTASYDGELAHSRVMGIMGLFFVADPSAGSGCGPLPRDLQTYRAAVPGGRLVAPRFIVPLTGLDGRGVARTIARPPGPTTRMPRGGTISAGSNFYSRRNVEVTSGSMLRWVFTGPTLHNVTLASGPQGFHSVHLNGGRSYARRFTRPGYYRLFCALHPVSMTGTVTVRPPPRPRT